MRQLPGWVTASKRSYQKDIFKRTWWNIVVFHTFFVLVMVIVFGYILYYTKLNIFTTLQEMLVIITQGGVVDSSLIVQASREIDLINIIVLSAMVVFAAITGIIAAHITLVPTRQEFLHRRRFITAVAHELRTPLAVLRTNNEVALYDVHKNSPIKSVLEENVEQTKMIANILNNLVVFSRVGNAESIPFEPIDLSIPLKSVVEKLTPFATRHKMVLSYMAQDLPPITCNETAVEQAFYNVIKNAIIYSKPGGGKVEIQATAQQTHVSIHIRDMGIGMSEEDLQHIFEPFYRINPDDSQSATGTGLGLALVLEIMKLHDGEITVESREGEGTTFTLRFPIASSKPIRAKTKTPHSVTYSFNS